MQWAGWRFTRTSPTEGAAFCLQAGANDLGGTLMNESITRAAGGVNGQEFGFAEMELLAKQLGRPSQQRTALYKPRITPSDKQASIPRQQKS